MSRFLVSVVIPVYNAEKYLSQAVESVVHLNEVGEVLLIEDKSPDNALQLCQQLSQEYAKVKLFQHPNGENRGAGESRNLGIKSASFDFIAFLDADDYFLPHRFEMTSKVFENFPETDGVYEAVGYFAEGHPDQYRLYTLSQSLKPDRVFHYLLRGTYGHFSTIGITLKRSIFEEAGYFSSALPLHQDTELWFRIAFHGRLRAGELKKPVAMARKHASNRITTANDASKQLYLQSVKRYFFDKKIGLINQLLIDRKLAQVIARQRGSFFLVEWAKQIFSK